MRKIAKLFGLSFLVAIIGVIFFTCLEPDSSSGGGADQTPVATDFEIGNLTQAVGNVTPVTIIPKPGKSTGVITIFYNGTTMLPTATGSYNVTFRI